LAGLLWLCGVLPAHALHAWPSDGVQNIPISTLKTRVGDFSFAASGRLSRRGESGPAITPGWRGWGCKNVSGRGIWNERDPNYLTFCGGDPVNGFDSDGRCVKAVGDFAYNGGVAGYALNGVGNALNSYSGDNAFLGAYGAYLGTLFNEVGGAVSPSTYVNGLSSYGHNVSSYYNDGGLLPASSYALTSWNVGQVYSGAANFDLHYDTAGQSVGDGYQRWATASSGVASTAGIAAGGVSLFNWATAAPAAAAPEATSFYRVVSEPEHQSLMGSGEFSAPPSGGSTPIPGQPGKWFWGSQQEAEQFAPGWYGSEPYKIIETKIPGSTAPASVAPGIDNVGTGYFFKMQDLQGVPINTVK
jgi:hypothetical protein